MVAPIKSATSVYTYISLSKDVITTGTILLPKKYPKTNLTVFQLEHLKNIDKTQKISLVLEKPLMF